MVIWLYGYMVIWLYDMVMSARQSVELLSVLASAIYLFSHSIRTYGGGMIPYLKFNILGDYTFPPFVYEGPAVAVLYKKLILNKNF